MTSRAPRAREGGDFSVALDVTVRLARAEDLEALEWFGLFRHHREILHEAFARQERGENLMVLAVANDFPVAQVWADLTRKGDGRTAYLWAIRTFPVLRGLGLGEHLLAAAERLLRERGYPAAELGVERDNPRARRFYERLGYEAAGELFETYRYTTPDGETFEVPVDEIIMRKRLGEDAPRARTGAHPRRRVGGRGARAGVTGTSPGRRATGRMDERERS